MATNHRPAYVYPLCGPTINLISKVLVAECAYLTRCHQHTRCNLKEKKHDLALCVLYKQQFTQRYANSRSTPSIPIILDVLAYMRVFSKVDVLAARETGLTRLPLSIRFHSRMHAVALISRVGRLSSFLSRAH